MAVASGNVMRFIMSIPVFDLLDLKLEPSSDAS